jgi:multisubunit Na+/H+ antiporter MnhE subunit
MKVPRSRTIALLLLLWRFPIAVANSGWQTTRFILRSPRFLCPGFAEYRYAPMSPSAATLLAMLICLTPGTTALDVDPGGIMRLHLLDARDVPAVLEEIRSEFEPLARVLFPLREKQP